MVALTPFAAIVYLLAVSNRGSTKGPNNRSSNRRKNSKHSQRNQDDSLWTKSSPPSSGTGNRSRYGRAGKKRITNQKNAPGGQGQNNRKKGKPQETSTFEIIPPALTKPNGLRPSYYTCRHGYEETLIDEIQRMGQIMATSSSSNEKHTIRTSSPSPGLVRVEDTTNILPNMYDPVYALQALPDSVVVSAESIKGLAKAVYQGLLGNGMIGTTDTENDGQEEDTRWQELCVELRNSERGSLAVHGVVPGMCKGQRNPVMLNRSEKIAEELVSILRKGFPAARKLQNDAVKGPGKKNESSDESEGIDLTDKVSEESRWLLQVMLMTPNVAVASLSKCKHIGPGTNFWPNWHHPVGMAKVDITEVMPSSAYRKLMEALECWRIRPVPFQSRATDLGACPGGWTSVLRRLDCEVTSVDRSKLDPKLMKDEFVHFVKGDAFTFIPEEMIANRLDEEKSPPNSWMVSDVIAYPERINELLDRWCGGHWATYMVVTMKFQGEKPSLSDLDHAIGIANQHGYECRAKHFFNNKNEVTLMIHERSKSDPSESLPRGLLGSSMYTALLPRDE